MVLVGWAYLRWVDLLYWEYPISFFGRLGIVVRALIFDMTTLASGHQHNDLFVYCTIVIYI